MNNPLNLAIEILPGGLPAGARIPAVLLDARRDWNLERAALLEAARLEAEQLLEQARLEHEQAQRDAAVTRAAVQQEAQALRREARAEGVANAVQWLCREQDMEQLIARQLALRWRNLTARMLEEMLGQCDQNELALRRVERKVAEWLPRGRLRLFVPTAALTAAQQAYAELEQVEVAADASLSAGQARLDNGLVRIHLDEPAHQVCLLEQLVGDSRRAAHA